MVAVINHGKDKETKRWLCTLAIECIDDLPSNLDLPSKHFCLLVVADSRRLTEKAIYQFAVSLLRQGAVYICTWGPGCERVHDLFDQARDELNPQATGWDIIMTSWHNDDTLDEVVWLAINTTWPADYYWDSCQTVLMVIIDNNEWAEKVSRRAEDPKSLNNNTLS